MEERVGGSVLSVEGLFRIRAGSYRILCVPRYDMVLLRLKTTGEASCRPYGEPRVVDVFHGVDQRKVASGRGSA